MSKNLPVTDEEIKLFRAAIGAVRPIQHNKHHLKPQAKNAYFSLKQDAGQVAAPAFWFATTESTPLQGDDCLAFSRPGLQFKLLKKLKKGLIPIEASLDLHRCTIAEAGQAVEQFIQQSLQTHKRSLCIIHGKGNYSKTGKAVLKTHLNQWLRSHPQVLAFHSARPKDGGTGALYVLLKLKGKK